MNNTIQKRLNQISMENNIWIIYLFIIGFSFYANHLERDYFLTQNKKSKDNYQLINACIFTVLILVYSYFEKDALDSYKQKNKTEKQKTFDDLSLFATTLVLISGFIFLYIIIEDNDLDAEVAFN